jgi:hypothetical protein
MEIDTIKADNAGVSSGLWERDWAFIPGEYRWWRPLDLESDEVHFFSRSKERQIDCLKDFIQGCIQTAASIEKVSVESTDHRAEGVEINDQNDDDQLAP